jgi:hypothetical protein
MDRKANVKSLQEVYENHSFSDGRGDKGTAHSYIDIYGEQIPAETGKSLLEVGVYEGHSINMWNEYLPESRVVGLDIDLSRLGWESLKSQVFLCDATDAVQIDGVLGGSSFDYIIDDGSHRYEEQVAGLRNLWGYLNVGGKYFIEDVVDIEVAQTLVSDIFSITGCEAVVYDLRSFKDRSDDILIQINKV